MAGSVMSLPALTSRTIERTMGSAIAAPRAIARSGSICEWIAGIINELSTFHDAMV